MRNPRIGVLSRKGGTGKTMVAVSLALSVAKAHLLDCDVEEPDAVCLAIRHRENVNARVPAIDPVKCDGCADRLRTVCPEVCEYGAVAVARGRVILNPARCNGCAASIDLCPRGALSEGAKTIGLLQEGEAGELLFARGTLRVGEPRAAELVHAVRRRARPDRPAVIDGPPRPGDRPGTGREGGIPLVVTDGPPGVACPAISALTGADLAVVVTEPSLGGRHDLHRPLDLAESLNVPATLVVNRHDLAPDLAARLEGECAACGVRPAGRIPYDPEVVRSVVRGVSPVEGDKGPAARALRRIAEAVLETEERRARA